MSLRFAGGPRSVVATEAAAWCDAGVVEFRAQPGRCRVAIFADIAGGQMGG